MFETVLSLDVPEYVDDFATDSILPINVVAKMDMYSIKGIHTKINVRVGDRMTVLENPPSSGEMLLQIPLSPSVEPRECGVVIEIEDNGEVINAVRKVVKTTGVNNLFLESPHLADSVFVRMNTECETLTSDIMADEAMQYLRPWKRIGEPTSVDACNFIENFLDYFKRFEYLPISQPNNGLLSIVGINDALEFRKADAVTMGLLFGHVAYKMNLKPILIQYSDTCLIGLKVMDNRPKVPVKEIVIDDPDHCSISNAKGTYVLADVSELTSMEDSLMAADMQYEGNVPICVCAVAFEKDREKYVSERYHSGRGNNTYGWE